MNVLLQVINFGHPNDCSFVNISIKQMCDIIFISSSSQQAYEAIPENTKATFLVQTIRNLQLPLEVRHCASDLMHIN